MKIEDLSFETSVILNVRFLASVKSFFLFWLWFLAAILVFSSGIVEWNTFFDVCIPSTLYPHCVVLFIPQKRQIQKQKIQRNKQKRQISKKWKNVFQNLWWKACWESGLRCEVWSWNKWCLSKRQVRWAWLLANFKITKITQDFELPSFVFLWACEYSFEVNLINRSDFLMVLACSLFWRDTFDG